MMNDKHGWSAGNTLEQLGGGEDGVTDDGRLFY